MIEPSSRCQSGMASIGGPLDMITAHACTPGVADQALEAAGGVEDRREFRVGLDQRPDLRGFVVALVLGVDCAGQRDVPRHDRRRQRLGDLVRDRVAVLAVLDAGGVLDGDRGPNGAEGDHLRHAAPYFSVA
jgi:hypothetical protein